MKDRSAEVARGLALAVLPKAARSRLTPEEIEAITSQFMHAGTAAVQAQHGTLHQAVKAGRAARQILSAARNRQADLTAPSRDAVVYQGRARVLKSAIQGRKSQWLKIPGVVGFGPGVRRRDGVETPEECITIFVLRKKSLRSLSRAHQTILPQHVTHRGAKIPVDVVELGRLRRFARGGASIGLVGLKKHGTLGTFALANETGLHVGLTAMHVTGLSSDFPPGVTMRFVSPRGGNALGVLVRGTLRDIDAARIDLDNPSQARLEISGIGTVRGWRPINSSSDRGAPVRMRGAVSGLVAGRIDCTSIDLPHENLRSAILVNIASDFGDSGAALVDNENLILGLLVGEAGTRDSLRVFSPIGPVLARMKCDIPTTL